MDLPYPILWKILVSLVGMVWLGYGRKKREWPPTLAGLLMCLSPYFLDNALVLVALAALASWAAWKLSA